MVANPNSTEVVKKPLFAVFAALGGACTVLGSFLPWLQVAVYGRTLTQTGLEMAGVGVSTLLIGLVATAIAITRLAATPRAWVQRIPVPLGVIAALFAALGFQYAQMKMSTNPYPGSITVTTGGGVYVLIVGAVLMVVGGLVIDRR